VYVIEVADASITPGGEAFVVQFTRETSPRTPHVLRACRAHELGPPRPVCTAREPVSVLGKLLRELGEE